MKTKFHGIDLHKRYATIIIRDSEGVESINNASCWSDQIEKQEASCIIVDPHKFKIIKDSWNKTDNQGNLRELYLLNQ